MIQFEQQMQYQDVGKQWPRPSQLSHNPWLVRGRLFCLQVPHIITVLQYRLGLEFRNTESSRSVQCDQCSSTILDGRLHESLQCCIMSKLAKYARSADLERKRVMGISRGLGYFAEVIEQTDDDFVSARPLYRGGA
jgi:hypothetical protein